MYYHLMQEVSCNLILKSEPNLNIDNVNCVRFQIKGRINHTTQGIENLQNSQVINHNALCLEFSPGL